jgi:hypothetical protein
MPMMAVPRVVSRPDAGEVKDGTIDWNLGTPYARTKNTNPATAHARLCCHRGGVGGVGGWGEVSWNSPYSIGGGEGPCAV